ncbi:MAG: hypothetical protein ACE5NJ_06100 [Thermodesulfobacteriota bacterium]
MDVWKCFLGLFLSFLLFPASEAFSHIDPPLMKLAMAPRAPVVDKEVKLAIHLRGSKYGVPVLGARIKIVLTNDRGKTLKYTAQPQSEGGKYLGVIRFPEKGIWKMRVDIRHRNEVDFREYTVHVVDVPAGSDQVMTDETILRKMLTHQPIPPAIFLGGYGLVVGLLLATVTVIKRRQRPT